MHFFIDLFKLMNITTFIDSHIRIIVQCQCKHVTEKKVSKTGPGQMLRSMAERKMIFFGLIMYKDSVE